MPLIQPLPAFPEYGDGADGVLNFDGTTTILGMIPSSGTYTLTRDLYLADGSQVSGTGVIQCSGQSIFCNGTFTIGSGRSVHRNGANGSGLTAGAGVGAAGLGSSTSGGNGVLSSAGLSGTVSSPSLGGYGGAGGQASGGGVGGGTGQTAATAPVGSQSLPHSLRTGLMVYAEASNTQYKGGSGGSGGSAATNSTGGGGGGGGGVVQLVCRYLVNNGTISANGGNGGNAAAGSGTGAGGGGGGGGGCVVIITAALLGTGTVTTTGGAGGTLTGTGATGAAGGAGTAYTLIHGV